MVDIKKLEQLYNIINLSDNIVFFGGAGISTASGIPDFRGAKGLYTYTPEEIISHSFFIEHTKEFYDFYFKKMVYLDALPNECHYFLTELERIGKLKSIITQNIDSLHQMAGSKKVLELHGSVVRNYCTKCNKYYDVHEIVSNDCKVPVCECGGIIKPDVVLYEECLDENTMEAALHDIRNCDTLIVAGTSLVVYPAAGLVRYFRGKNLIVINLDNNNLDVADLYINGRVEEYLNRDNFNKYIWKKN